jgi:hypothetical protein
LIASLQDQGVALFSGYTVPDLITATQALGATMQGQQAAFMIETTVHTLLGEPNTMTSTQVSLRTWVDAWATGGFAFATVGP